MPEAPKHNDPARVQRKWHSNCGDRLARIDTTARGCSGKESLIPTTVLFLALLLGGGCSSSPPAFRAQCPSSEAADYYFPAGSLDPKRSKIDGMLREWYSKYLRAAGEPSLSCGPRADGYAFRFLWLRSFHHPITVRVETVGDSATVTAVELGGTGGRAPEGVVKRVQRALSGPEVDTFLTKLNQVKVEEMQKGLARFGIDGAQWIVEGVRNGQYQVVDRWTPTPGAYRDLGKAFLDLAGFEIPVADLY